MILKRVLSSLLCIWLITLSFPIGKAKAAASVATALPGVIEFLGTAIGIYEGATIRNDPTDAMREGVTDIAKLYALSQFESLKNSLSATYDSVSNWFVKSDALSNDLKTFKGLSFAATVPDGLNIGNYALSARYDFFDGQNNYSSILTKEVLASLDITRKWAWLRDGLLFQSIVYVEEQRKSPFPSGTLMLARPYEWKSGTWTSSAFYFDMGNIGYHDFNGINGGRDRLIEMVGYPVNVAEYNATISGGYNDQAFKDALPDKIRIPALEDFKPVDTSTGEDLTYRPTTQDYVNPAGNVIPTPRVKWTYPTPTIVKDTAGKDVVGWTDKTTGTTKTWDGSISTDIPNTGSATLDKIGTNTEIIKDSLTSTTATTGINFQPLLLAGGTFTEKFPFSIPWDVGRQLSVFNVEPQSPVFKVDKSIDVFGYDMKMKFDIDFSAFDGLAVIARWFLLIAFDIGMILGIRRLLPE